MKHHKGMTLVEVIIAMMIMSIALTAFVTVFGRGALFVSQGEGITRQSFDHQEIMENKWISEKDSFLSDSSLATGSVDIFTGDYQSTVAIREVVTSIQGNRQYAGYVSNFAFQEPLAPQASPFAVDVYEPSTNTRVFPWIDDGVEVRADYTLLSDPVIFQNTSRWYQSNEDIVNPVFPSEYSVVDEVVQDTPTQGISVSDILPDASEVAERFYYFEIQPYTLAGRLAHYRNEQRILLLNRAGSTEWQDFVESIYFDTAKRYTIDSEETYAEVLQNPFHPTLNVDYSAEMDPEGALVGVPVPLTGAFRTGIEFSLDHRGMSSNSGALGVGFGLVDADNSGIMVTIDPLLHTLSLYGLNNGDKDATIDQTIQLLEISSPMFTFVETIDGSDAIDWTKDYRFDLIHLKNNEIIRVIPHQKDDDGNWIAGGKLEIDLSAYSLTPDYVGLKSFNGLEYLPDLSSEIANPYDRNYGAHIYNVTFASETETGSGHAAFEYALFSTSSLTTPNGTTIDGGVYGKGISIDPSSNEIDGSIVSLTELNITGGNDVIINGNICALDGNVSISVGTNGAVNGNIYANGDVIIASSNKINGEIIAQGSVTLNNASEVRGRIIAGNNVILENSNVLIDGDVHSGGNLVVGNNGSITGSSWAQGTNDHTPDAGETALDGQGSPPRILPQQPDTCVAEPIEPPDFEVITPNMSESRSIGGNATLLPGVYGDLSFSANATLTLSSGTYVFNDIDSSKDVTFRYDLSGGPVNIYVANSVSMTKNVSIAVSSDGSTYTALSTHIANDLDNIKTLAGSIYWEVQDVLDMTQSVQWIGTTYVRNNLSMDKDATIVGSLALESEEGQILFKNQKPTIYYAPPIDSDAAFK